MQTRLYYLPILHCFSATRTSRDTLLPIGDMTALKTASRHYRHHRRHCHVAIIAMIAKVAIIAIAAAAAAAKSQLHARTYSCIRSAAAAARRFVRSTQNRLLRAREAHVPHRALAIGLGYL